MNRKSAVICLEKVAFYLYEVLVLNYLPRSGYSVLGMKPPSVAKHALRVAQIAKVLAKQEGCSEEEQALAFFGGLIHDNPEARTLDHHYIAKMYSKCDEEKALRMQNKDLGEWGEFITQLWLDIDNKMESVGRIVKNADYLDLAFECIEHQEHGHDLPYEIFFSGMSEAVQKYPHARKMCENMEELGYFDWKRKYLNNRIEENIEKLMEMQAVFWLAALDGAENPVMEVYNSFYWNPQIPKYSSHAHWLISRFFNPRTVFLTQKGEESSDARSLLEIMLADDFRKKAIWHMCQRPE